MLLSISDLEKTVADFTSCGTPNFQDIINWFFLEDRAFFGYNRLLIELDSKVIGLVPDSELILNRARNQKQHDTMQQSLFNTGLKILRRDLQTIIRNESAKNYGRNLESGERLRIFESTREVPYFWFKTDDEFVIAIPVTQDDVAKGYGFPYKVYEVFNFSPSKVNLDFFATFTYPANSENSAIETMRQRAAELSAYGINLREIPSNLVEIVDDHFINPVNTDTPRRGMDIRRQNIKHQSRHPSKKLSAIEERERELAFNVYKILEERNPGFIGKHVQKLVDLYSRVIEETKSIDEKKLNTERKFQFVIRIYTEGLYKEFVTEYNKLNGIKVDSISRKSSLKGIHTVEYYLRLVKYMVKEYAEDRKKAKEVYLFIKGTKSYAMSIDRLKNLKLGHKFLGILDDWVSKLGTDERSSFEGEYEETIARNWNYLTGEVFSKGGVYQRVPKKAPSFNYWFFKLVPLYNAYRSRYPINA